MKRLTLSNDRFLMGVCGGVANYFNIDPTIVRLLTVIAFFAIPITPIVYVIMGFVLPSEY